MVCFVIISLRYCLMQKWIRWESFHFLSLCDLSLCLKPDFKFILSSSNHKWSTFPSLLHFFKNFPLIFFPCFWGVCLNLVWFGFIFCKLHGFKRGAFFFKSTFKVMPLTFIECYLSPIFRKIKETNVNCFTFCYSRHSAVNSAEHNCSQLATLLISKPGVKIFPIQWEVFPLTSQKLRTWVPHPSAKHFLSYQLK